MLDHANVPEQNPTTMDPYSSDPYYRRLARAALGQADAWAIWTCPDPGSDDSSPQRLLNPLEQRLWAYHNFPSCRALTRAFCKDWAWGEFLAADRPALLVAAAKRFAAIKIGRAAERFDVPAVQTAAAAGHDARVRAEYMEWFGLRQPGYDYDEATLASFTSRTRRAVTPVRCATSRRPARLVRPQNRRRGAGRPRAMARSSSRSGDSGEDSPEEPAPAVALALSDSTRCPECGGVLLFASGVEVCAYRRCSRYGEAS
jgi:hypothetical protein